MKDNNKQKYILRPKPRIGFLPIGCLKNKDLEQDYERGKKLIYQLDAEIVESPLVWEQPDVLANIAELQRADIDLLVQYVLHGMSAEQQTLVGVKTDVPTVLLALPTNYSFSSCASAFGALRERGCKVKLLSLSPGEEEDAVRDLIMIARVAYTMSELKRTRIGALGGIFPNLPADQYHRDIVADKLGPQIIHLPISVFQEFLKQRQNNDSGIAKEIVKLRDKFKVEVDDSLLAKAICFHLALGDLADQKRLTAIALECHTELTPLFDINPCFGFADPNCTYLPICEGDVIRGINMLIVSFLTGGDSYIGDTIFVKDGVLTLAHCGSSCGLAKNGNVVIKEQLAPSHVVEGKRQAMCMPEISPGEVTLMRLHGQYLDQFHLALGKLTSTDMNGRLNVHIDLHNPCAFLKHICGNHYVIAKGDLRPQLTLLCDWSGIKITET